MVEFKAVIADPKSRKTYNTTVAGHHANSLIGKEIGDEFDGIFVSLPGFKLQITGGSDKSGFPMRKDFKSQRRQKILLTEGLGFHPEHAGTRQKKTVLGNVVTPQVYQINMKIVNYGSKSIDQLLPKEEEKK
jgi:small subunit ribosomal protein S6e